MVIAFANQKGGSGKTTGSMHLGALLHEESYDVVIADADPQQSAAAWAASAPDDQPWPTAVVGISEARGKAHHQLRELKKKYDVVIVDCAPSADDVANQSIFLVADMIVVPVLPSGTDIHAVTGIIKLADQARSLRETAGEEGDVLPLYVLLNQYLRTRVLAREAIDVLSEQAQVLRTTIAQREAFRQASAAGTTAWALGNKDARRDFNKLLKEIQS